MVSDVRITSDELIKPPLPPSTNLMTIKHVLHSSMTEEHSKITFVRGQYHKTEWTTVIRRWLFLPEEWTMSKQRPVSDSAALALSISAVVKSLRVFAQTNVKVVALFNPDYSKATKEHISTWLKLLGTDMKSPVKKCGHQSRQTPKPGPQVHFVMLHIVHYHLHEFAQSHFTVLFVWLNHWCLSLQLSQCIHCSWSS